MAQDKVANTFKFVIAVGQSAKSKEWANKSVTLERFLKKLKSPVVQDITEKDYITLTNEEKSKLKDVGGFVGGELRGKSRKAGEVLHRWLITLDADYADSKFLDKVGETLALKHTVYSTRSHTQDTPRFRVIFYSEVAISPEDSPKISRYLAGLIGIEYFDPTSFETNRLMYWPSCNSDSDYFFSHHEGEFISEENLKVMLSICESGLPISKLELARASNEQAPYARKEKMQDPRTKGGIIGAFCNVYSIHRVIREFLYDIYDEGSVTDRYTYIGASTTNGLAVYDDGLFCHSNHSTDPIYGMTLNAFDLLRLHKYRHLDDIHEGLVPEDISKRASYRACIECVEALNDVRIYNMSKYFSPITEDDSLDTRPNEVARLVNDLTWMAKLETDKKGNIEMTLVNAITILTNDNKIKNKMQFNELSLEVETHKGELWTDLDSVKIRKHVGTQYKTDFPACKIEDAILYRANAPSNTYHPIKTWLLGLTWDGVKRCERLWIDWLGVADTPYARQTALCWLVAAVKRVFEPGAKFDTVPVIYGKQGIGKSLFVQTLGRGWYGELHTYDHKLAAETMGGKWILEITELSANTRGEIEQQKAFLSACSTKVRMAYAKHTTEFKRQCVFIGTTNQEQFLQDSTGNRRWWPIDAQCDLVDIHGLREVVGQIWAEAYQLYLERAPTVLAGDAAREAAATQADKMIDDEWQGVIEGWLTTKGAVDRYDSVRGFESLTEDRGKVCALEIWQDCLRQKGDINKTNRIRIGAAMARIKEYEKKDSIRFGDRFGRQRGWVKNIHC